MSWLVPSLPSLGWSRAQPTPASQGYQQEEEEDLDVPPPFPLPESHQRSQAPPISGPKSDPAPSLSVAPPSPTQEPAEPPSDLNIAILPDATPLGNMAPPPSTTVKPAFGIQAAEAPVKKTKGRGKVALTPGHSALDWARLTSSGKDLRGTGPGFLRVTMDELKKHKTREDAWSVFNGKVYNITPYIPFHPGGEDELMRVAGRDGTKLFMLTHSWVNMEFMLQECMVGVLVRG
ncbi:putative heme binding protein [Papiliotrema laurentii]|uniref:Heme binding protein n=1 Tax=Papiliotrema laurentii TaxID=5418 RepID=A0AAD9FST2_PAPLA|nr:putative heme binding protein [Papiliotrema laurentii]